MKRLVTFCNVFTGGLNLIELNQLLIWKQHFRGGGGGLLDDAGHTCVNIFTFLLEVAWKFNRDCIYSTRGMFELIWEVSYQHTSVINCETVIFEDGRFVTGCSRYLQQIEG